MTTDTTTDNMIHGAAVDAALAVFNEAPNLPPPPRGLLMQALDAAGAVYARADELELDRIVGEAQLAGMDIQGRDVAIRFRQSQDVLRGIVAAFDTLVAAHGAANYVTSEVAVPGPPAADPRWVEQTTSFTDPDAIPLRRYHVTVVKPDGKSPHELRQAAEQRAAAAEAKLNAVRALIRGGWPIGPRQLAYALGDLVCSCPGAADGGDWADDFDDRCPVHASGWADAEVLTALLGPAREATRWTMGAWAREIRQAPGERTPYDGMLANVLRAVLDVLDPAPGGEPSED